MVSSINENLTGGLPEPRNENVKQGPDLFVLYGHHELLWTECWLRIRTGGFQVTTASSDEDLGLCFLLSGPQFLYLLNEDNSPYSGNL